MSIEDMELEYKSAQRRKTIYLVGGVLLIGGIATYNVLKTPSSQVKDPSAIAAPAEQTPDHAAALKSNPQDSKFIMSYLDKLPEETSKETLLGVRDVLDILMKDSENLQTKRAALFAEIENTSAEELLLIQDPYNIFHLLHEGSPLLNALRNSNNPRLRPLKMLLEAYPVVAGKDPEQKIRNMTLLLEKLLENEAYIPEDLTKLNFESTIREIRDNKDLPVSGASILYARPKPTPEPVKTSSYLESLRDSKINRQSKRDVFKLA